MINYYGTVLTYGHTQPIKDRSDVVAIESCDLWSIALTELREME